MDERLDDDIAAQHRKELENENDISTLLCKVCRYPVLRNDYRWYHVTPRANEPGALTRMIAYLDHIAQPVSGEIPSIWRGWPRTAYERHDEQDPRD